MSNQCKKCQKEIPENRKFCSSKCSNSFNNIGICRHGKEKNCLSCGNRIINQNWKFCSETCKQKHRETKITSGQLGHVAIKRYLISLYGDNCMSPTCGWNNHIKRVKTELEHIDGNSQNNKLENCILLCPGCHSLTPTYKNKNKGNGRFKRRERYQQGLSY